MEKRQSCVSLRHSFNLFMDLNTLIMADAFMAPSDRSENTDRNCHDRHRHLTIIQLDNVA